MRTGPITLRAEISDQAGNMATTQATVRDDGPPADRSRGQRAPAANCRDGIGGETGQRCRDWPAWPIDHVTNQTVGQTADATSAHACAERPGIRNAAASSGTITDRSLARCCVSDPPTAPSRRGIQSAGRKSFFRRRFGGNSIFTARPAARRAAVYGQFPPFALDYEVDRPERRASRKSKFGAPRRRPHLAKLRSRSRASQGPIKVKVDGEGLYGFRIAVRRWQRLDHASRRIAAICPSCGSASI